MAADWLGPVALGHRCSEGNVVLLGVGIAGPLDAPIATAVRRLEQFLGGLVEVMPIRLAWELTGIRNLVGIYQLIRSSGKQKKNESAEKKIGIGLDLVTLNDSPASPKVV